MHTVVKCTECTFALCTSCAAANRIPFSSAAGTTSSVHATSSTPTIAPAVQHQQRFRLHIPDTVSEEKVEENNRILAAGHQQPRQGLFPSDQTIQFGLINSGRSKDLAERLSLFVNSRLGSKENQVEHVTIKPDLDLAWVVLRSPEILQQFCEKCGRETVIDLLDGWKVKWQVYSPPHARRVYKLDGLQPGMVLECSMIRRLIEEQLKMVSADIDLVVASEGAIRVIFSHGEHDVGFARSIFLENGAELSLVPTAATV